MVHVVPSNIAFDSSSCLPDNFYTFMAFAYLYIHKMHVVQVDVCIRISPKKILEIIVDVIFFMMQD